MGVILGRKGIRENILALELRIEEKEKEVKRRRRTYTSIQSILIKVEILLVFIWGVSVWVFKEAFSAGTIARMSFAFFAVGVGAGAVGALVSGTQSYYLNKKTKELNQLKEKQRKNIERLKEETKYEETHKILKKYEEQEEEKEKKETLVERIIEELI